MDDLVSTASALANALVRGRTLQELQRLQVILQIVLSVVSAEITALRLET